MNNPRFKKQDVSSIPEDVLAARAKLKQRFGNKTRVGGKGSTRRKKNTHHKTNVNDDKKIRNGLRKFGL